MLLEFKDSEYSDVIEHTKTFSGFFFSDRAFRFHFYQYVLFPGINLLWGIQV
jgi:hypothetical protein